MFQCAIFERLLTNFEVRSAQIFHAFQFNRIEKRNFCSQRVMHIHVVAAIARDNLLQRAGDRQFFLLVAQAQQLAKVSRDQYSGMLLLSRRSSFMATRKKRLSEVGRLTAEKNGS
jgi:hypothetical protein